MAAKKYYLGIDIGGTKLLAVVFDRQFKVVSKAKEKVEKNEGFSFFQKSLDGAVKKALSKAGLKMAQIQSIGLGCAGMIDFPDGVVKLSPNLPFLNGKHLKELLRKKYRKPLLVENDVNAGLYGEFSLGAARGYDHVIGVFPGTGVGGGLILNGDLYRGATGAAGEVGHMFMRLDPLAFDRRGVGTLEAMVGRLQIAAEAAKHALVEKAPTLYERYGSDIRKIKSRALFEALDAADHGIVELLTEKSKVLGLGLANLVNILNPQAVILGGGVMEAMGKFMLPIVKETMKKYGMPPNTRGVVVKLATLGDYSVAAGAASLAADYYQR